MRTIKTKDLKPGMKFDKPVYVDGENILVPPGIPLKERDIERLIKWDIEEVQTDGELISEKAEFLQGEWEQGKIGNLSIPENREYVKKYLEIVAEVAGIFNEIKTDNEVYHTRIDDIVSRLMNLIRENKHEVIQLTLVDIPSADEFAGSAVNCTILSVVIGMNLKFVSHRLMQLATAALLHDIGMLRIPTSILGKNEKLSPEEYQQVKMHTIHTYKIISHTLKYPEEIASIALQHHERWDGKGYPRGLRGNDILLPSRIISVADAYEAMVRERPYRNSMIAYNAMKEILNDNGRRFDPKVLKAFLKSMGVYPIGSIVQLNNSSIGKVVENHPEAPLRPKLELIVDEYGDKYAEKEVIDLLNKKNLFIVKAVDYRKLEK